MFVWGQLMDTTRRTAFDAEIIGSQALSCGAPGFVDLFAPAAVTANQFTPNCLFIETPIRRTQEIAR